MCPTICMAICHAASQELPIPEQSETFQAHSEDKANLIREPPAWPQMARIVRTVFFLQAPTCREWNPVQHNILSGLAKMKSKLCVLAA